MGLPELADAAKACAEAIGVDGAALTEEFVDLEPHCGTSGKTVERQLTAIPTIQKGWMVTGVTQALAEHRKKAED